MFTGLNGFEIHVLSPQISGLLRLQFSYLGIFMEVFS